MEHGSRISYMVPEHGSTICSLSRSYLRAVAAAWSLSTLLAMPGEAPSPACSGTTGHAQGPQAPANGPHTTAA